MHSFPRNPADFGHTNQSQELMHGGADSVGTLGPQRPGTAQGGAAAGGGQPLLRRNQYWVWQRYLGDVSAAAGGGGGSEPDDSGVGLPESDSGGSGSYNKRHQMPQPPPQPIRSNHHGGGSGAHAAAAVAVPQLDENSFYYAYLQHQDINSHCCNGGGLSNNNPDNFGGDLVVLDHHRLTDTLGKPLKGILKNNQFQSLPRNMQANQLLYNNTTQHSVISSRSLINPNHELFQPNCSTSDIFQASGQTANNVSSTKGNEVIDTVESSV